MIKVKNNLGQVVYESEIIDEHGEVDMHEFEKGIFIQGRYGYGLTEVFDDRNYKNSCISLSLGYFFN